MSETPIQKIYNKLRTAPQHHPSTANLFADWTLQAGDVVTVQSGNDSYQVPVYGMDLNWTGGGDTQVEVQATGNRTREPLPEMQRRAYSSGRATSQKYAGYDANIVKTDRSVRLYAKAVGVQTDQNGDPIIDETTGEYVFDPDSENSLYSEIRVNVDAIELETTRARGAESTLSGRIDVQAGKIGLVVEDVPGGGSQISQASIILAINGDGTSSTAIKADKIDISGADININGSSSIKIGDVIKTTTVLGQTVASVEANTIKGTYITGGNVTFNTLDYAPGGSASIVHVDPVKTIAANANPPSGQIGITVTPLIGQPYDVNFNIAATQKYITDVAAAWGEAYSKVELPGTGTGTSFVIKTPGATKPTQSSKTYWLQQSGNVVFVADTANLSDSIARLPVSGAGGTLAPAGGASTAALSGSVWYSTIDINIMNGSTVVDTQTLTIDNQSTVQDWADQWAAATWPAAGSSASVTIDRPGAYRDLVLSLVQGTGNDRRMVYMRNQDGGTIAQYETAVDVWDSTIYNVNDEPTGVWRTVAVNTAYTYHYLTISANGVERKIRINVY